MCPFSYFFFSDAANLAARSSSHTKNKADSSSGIGSLSVLLASSSYRHFFYSFIGKPYSLAFLWTAYDYSKAVATKYTPDRKIITTNYYSRLDVESQ